VTSTGGTELAQKYGFFGRSGVDKARKRWFVATSSPNLALKDVLYRFDSFDFDRFDRLDRRNPKLVGPVFSVTP
jgi:hypothetical protein